CRLMMMICMRYPVCWASRVRSRNGRVAARHARDMPAQCRVGAAQDAPRHQHFPRPKDRKAGCVPARCCRREASVRYGTMMSIGMSAKGWRGEGGDRDQAREERKAGVKHA